MTKPRSSRRAQWAAQHPIAIGVLSGAVLFLAWMIWYRESLGQSIVVAVLFGLVIWIGWRPGGWARRIEERRHELDID